MNFLGRDDHNTPSNNKNSLPQTPKELKIAPNDVREEFSRELTDIIQTSLRPGTTGRKNKTFNRKR